MAPDIDWSQFSTEPETAPSAAPASQDVDWSQFSESPDEAPADFGNVQAGTASVPLAQFAPKPSAWERVKDRVRNYLDESATGIKAIAQGGDYQVAPDDKRRVMSDAEGFGRTFAEDVTGLAKIAYDYGTPVGVTTKLAETFGAPKVDPMRNLLEKQGEVVGVNPETMRFQSPRGEAFATGTAHLLAGYLPETRVARSLDEFLSPEARAVMNAGPEGRTLALTGDLGPEAQGSAAADEILSRAVADRPAVPERPAAEVVPADATFDVPGEAGIAVRGETVAPAQVQEADLAPAVRSATIAEEAAPAPSSEAVEAPDEPAAPAKAETLYHASLSPDIEAFDVARSGSQSDTGVFGRAAAYATGDERLAPFYLGAKKSEGTLYQVEHALKNPAEFDSPQAAIEWQGERGTDSPEAAERVRQKYLDAGHDGVIVRNPQTGRVMEAAVFDPAAIKITGKRSIGAKASEPARVPEDRGPLPGPIDTSSIPFESGDALPPRLRGARRAEAVRGNQEVVLGAREVGSRSQAAGGYDIQRAQEAGRSIPERLRASREGGAPAAPVRAEAPPLGPPNVPRGTRAGGDGGNPRLPARLRELAKGRGIWDSATDVLKRTPEFRPLGEAIERHYDTMQRREGETSRFLREPVKAATKADRDNFTEYQAAIQNGRTPPKLTPGAKRLAEAWQKFAEHSGAENQRVGVRVFDAKLGKVRPIGRAKDFFPRTLKREYADAMRDPGKHKAAWDRMVGILKDKGVIESEEEAGRFLRDHFSDTASNDYFAGIEKARSEPLPEELYDYSVEAGLRYAKRWAERLSQIEAFGQKLGEHEQDLFDIFKGKTTDEGTKAYIDAVGKIVYNVRSRDDFAKFAQTLNAIATGLQLGNPATSALNLVGGLFQNAATFGVGNMVRALGDLRHLSKAIKDAHEIGVLRGDYLDLLHDNEVMDVPNVVNTMTRAALKVGGYDFTENVNRMHGYMTARAWLRQALAAKPGSGAARQYQRLLDKADVDVAKIKAGDQAETEKFYRKAVNEAQFSYNLSQTPVYANTAVGKFLLKYQKFGLQMSRYYWQNVVEPFIKSPNARTGGNLLRYWIAAAVGGAVILDIRDKLFGYQNAAPDMSEIDKALEQKKYQDAIVMTAQRAWVAQLAIGGLGFFSNYVQMGEDIADRQRVKNPLNPPGIAPIAGLANLGLTLYDQKGNGVVRALEEFATANVALYRTGKRLAGAALGTKASKAERDYGFAKKMTRRYADERNIEAKRRAPSEIAATPMTPVNKDIHDALMVGDPKEAKRIAREYIESLPTAAEQRAAWNSIKASARARQPTLVSVSPSAAERRDFLAWARTHLEAPEYDRIARIDQQYRAAAVKAGMLKEDNADKLDRAADKREQERKEAMSPDELDRMLGDSNE